MVLYMLCFSGRWWHDGWRRHRLPFTKWLFLLSLLFFTLPKGKNHRPLYLPFFFWGTKSHLNKFFLKLLFFSARRLSHAWTLPSEFFRANDVHYSSSCLLCMYCFVCTMHVLDLGELTTCNSDLCLWPSLDWTLVVHQVVTRNEKKGSWWWYLPSDATI